MVAQAKLSSLEVLNPAVEGEMRHWYLLEFSHKEAQQHTNYSLYENINTKTCLYTWIDSQK